jgi:hypothetical protein
MDSEATATAMANTTLLDNDERDRLCDLGDFPFKYKSIHGYVSMVVCIFGTIANILNIAVLTRKEMNGSPINRILTGKVST